MPRSRAAHAASSTFRRSTILRTASAACRASTSCAGSSACGSSRASTTSSTSAWRPRRRSGGGSSSSCVRRLRDVYGQHRCDASRGHHDAQLAADGTARERLPRPRGRHARRQRRGPGRARRLPGRVDAAARLRDLRDPVPDLHPRSLAPALQRSLLHLELPPRVLLRARPALGERQRPRRQAVGGGRAERTPPGGARR